MGGHSGSAVASHTKLAYANDGKWSCAITEAQHRLLARALAKTGRALFVKGSEARTARKLELLRLGTLEDFGSFGPKQGYSNVDGERWMFTVAEGVTISHGS